MNCGIERCLFNYVKRQWAMLVLGLGGRYSAYGFAACTIRVKPHSALFSKISSHQPSLLHFFL